VNLKTFSINENKLTVSGSAANTELLIDYIDNMNQSPYFSQVTLQNYLNQENISFDLIATVTEGGEDDAF
ncbi:MAG TPA: PilN domain-containing protein, partial [Halanaerobiales bacterium]|nr:PilN domain-containing protein [Halanaerobiales bacterium]